MKQSLAKSREPNLNQPVQETAVRAKSKTAVKKVANDYYTSGN